MPAKVTLISYTPFASDVLIFTKSTRLNMSPGLFDEIKLWPVDRKLEELAYMADTIPSSWEFVDYIFTVEGVSRAYTHQQVRTRTGSYAQQSLRIVDAGEFEYVMSDRIAATANAGFGSPHDITGRVLSAIRWGYKQLRLAGIPAEDARGILPTNIATNIVCKFNLRTMAELARSRTGGRTQDEYIVVINAMIDAVLAVHPWAEAFLFAKQRDYFTEIEAFASREFGGNLVKKGELLKIVDKMRKGD